ncbi:SH3 domain-containing kinase-binding protein 1 [Neoarius graeffei]|uniref:SH3 domain-containing kinase-binding protein 1 n=1 Tax=Neoarius graeffei TaxID=443677 RepID=UPI00298C895C|nr:SH3 domain-containing kinase-binding protein 1 [Neoarius graeffei]
MVEAVVEFDYQAQHDDELTIAIGDIISNIRKDEGGWWEGEVDGRRGLFPDNFVREIKKEVKKELSSNSQAAKSDLSNGSASPRSESSLRPAKKGEAIRKRRCKAAFSYIPQNEDELELKIGDIIEILGEVEEGWWEGCLNGRTGMFPSNFTKELPANAEDLATPSEDTRSTRTSVKDSTGSESDGGDSVRSDAGSAASSSEIQPKKVRGFGFGDIFKDQPIKLRPRSMDLENELEKPPVKKPAPSVPQENMKTEPENKPKVKEFCKVLFPYDAQNEDELSVKEGDIVTIISKECADAGWWLGELNGKEGVFPDNFVKLFVPEVEKERPKKPPPPAAPASKPLTDKKPEVKKVPPERPESLPQRAEEKGDEIKLVEVQKPVPPVFPPKKPLPPKTNNSLNRPSSLPPKRPERPERPVAPSIQCDGPGVASDRTSSDKSAEIDIDDFDSIVSSTEKLSHPTASRPRVTDRRPRSQIFTSSSVSSPDLLDSLSLEDEQREKGKGKDEPDSFPPKPQDNTRKMPKALPIITAPEKSSKPSTLTATPGAAALRPHSPSMEAKIKSDQGSTTLEELRAQLRELRAIVELMKSQHKQEMKQLVSELDEEKKIRLSLQMDVENIKKVLSK